MSVNEVGTTFLFKLLLFPNLLSSSDSAPWLGLNQLELNSFQREEYRVFTTVADGGQLLDQEQSEQMF